MATDIFPEGQVRCCSDGGATVRGTFRPIDLLQKTSCSRMLYSTSMMPRTRATCYMLWCTYCTYKWPATVTVALQERHCIRFVSPLPSSDRFNHVEYRVLVKFLYNTVGCMRKWFLTLLRYSIRLSGVLRCYSRS